MRCISFLSLFSFHSLIVRFPLLGCFYLQSLPSFRFVPLALLALACPGVCFFVSCFFVLAGLGALPFADFHFYLVGQWRPTAPAQPVFVFRWIRFPVNLPPTSSSSDFSFSPSASLHSTPSIHLSLLPNHPLPEVFPASFIEILQVCPRYPSPFLYIASHPRFSPPSRIRLLPLPLRGSTIFVDSLSLDSLPTAFAHRFGRLPAFCLSYMGLNAGSNRFSLRFFRPPGREAPNFGRKSG